VVTKGDRGVSHLNGGETAERLSPVGGSKAGDFSFIRVESKAIMEKPASERK